MEKAKIKLNWPLVGNTHIFEFLAKSLANKSIASSYIFAGPANIGKTTAAHYFARSLVCLPAPAGQSASQLVLPCGQCPACLQAAKGIHSDIYLIKRPADKKNISIEQVRSFITSLGMSSFLNSYKIGIIKSAESLSEGAVNALLKTLEEPKAKVVIILTVADFEVLPKTIISRSQVLRFRPVASDEIFNDLIKNQGALRSQAKNFSRLAAGRPALAVKFLKDKKYYESYKTNVRSFIEFLSPDINQRFKAVDTILAGRLHGQELVRTVGGVIDIWQNLTRDLMLLELGLADLVQHQAFDKELAAIKSKLSLKGLVGLIGVLKQAKEYLAANVNPKLTLENVVVSF
jgi:DNA polymerase III gamma/tau subunit